MKYLSICSGIEAASVAWHSLGWEPVGFSEIEPFPCAVLKHHYPAVPNLGDMTKHKEWNLGRIDLLVGGTPCQAFSVAGARRGLDDERGNLTLTFCNIADQFLPRFTLWENVPGVLSDKTNAFGCLLAGLAGLDEPLETEKGKWPGNGLVVGGRRRVAWVTLDAQYFGVPQRRRRVFVLAVDPEAFADPRNVPCPAQILSIGQSLRRDTPARRKTGEEAAGTLKGGSGERCAEIAPSVSASGPPFSRTGNERVECEALVGSWWDGSQVSQTLDAVLYKGQTMPEKNRFPAVLTFNHQTGGDFRPQVQENLASARQRQQGQAAAFTQCDAARDIGENVSMTLRSGGAGGYPNHSVATQMQVRRLTPEECEALQGFPRGYTDIRPKGKDTPDGPRYKALGNSMAVPVMRWIGQRIQEVSK